MHGFTGAAAMAVSATVLALLPAAVLTTDHADAAAATTPVGGPIKTLAQRGSDSAVVTDRFGTTTAVWAAEGWPGGAIRAARRAAGGGWSRPVTLGRGAVPLVDVDSQGAVTVVWQTNRNGYTSGVAASRRSPGGPWRRAVRLSVDSKADYHPSPDQDEGHFGAHRLDLDVSPGGFALVAWQWGSDHRNRPTRIQSVSRPPAGPWRRPVRLTPRNWSSNPRVAVGRHGRAAVGYESPEDGSVVIRRRGLTGRWGREVTVTSRETNGHEVLMDLSGKVTVVFDRFDGVFARRLDSGRFRPPVELSSGMLGGAVVDRSGTVSVTATRNSGRVDMIRRVAAWGAPRQLGNTDPFTAAALSLSPGGDLIVSWLSPRGRMMARGRVAGVGWTAPFRLSAADGHFQLPAASAFDGGGGVFIWQTPRERLKARAFR
jgi:hypothetical protein